MQENNSRPIHVVHIASGDLWAGAEAQLYTLATSLIQLPNTKVSIILLNHGTLEQKLISANIPVYVYDETTLNGFSILFRMIKKLRELKPDVVHTHRLKENILGSLACLFAGNIPSIRTVHGAAEHSAKWTQLAKQCIYLIDRLVGKLLQKTIVAVSNDLASILEKNYPKQKIRVIENGVDINYIFSKIRDTPPTTLPKSHLCLGIIGRLVPVKRVDIAIEALRLLTENSPELNAKLTIIGDGPLRRQLVATAGELVTDKKIIFKGHCDDIYNELSELDTLLITSDHEGLPMVLLEAMTLGVPVIAHSVGGISHVIDNGRNGLLVKPATPKNIEEQVRTLFYDKKLQESIAVESKRTITESYSSSLNAQSYAELYNIIT